MIDDPIKLSKLSPEDLNVLRKIINDIVQQSMGIMFRTSTPTASTLEYGKLSVEDDGTDQGVHVKTGKGTLLDLRDSDKLDGQEGTYYENLAFGSWASKSDNTVYQATDGDGFVCVTLTCAANSRAYSQGYTDSSNPPTTVRRCDQVNYYTGSSLFDGYGGYTMPVKKDDYYKVVKTAQTGTVTQTIYWIPIE